MRKRKTLAELVEEKSIPEPNTGCRLWLGSTTQGYATLLWKNMPRIVNRVQLGLEKGSGKMALHRCDNRPCVELRHLYVGDGRDNLRDALERGGATRGVDGKLLSTEEGREYRRDLANALTSLGITLPKEIR